MTATNFLTADDLLYQREVAMGEVNRLKRELSNIKSVLAAILRETGPVEVSMYDLLREDFLRITQLKHSATVRYEAFSTEVGA